MAMKRVLRDGKVINKRTDAMLDLAERRLGQKLYVIQGSYNVSKVAASAGTHDGGGAVDIAPTKRPKRVVRMLRKVGFAAWHRLPSQGPWVEHIHAIAIGDPEMSRSAATQVREYYARRNGLGNRGPDDGPRLNPIPVWPIKLPKFSIRQIRRQMKADNPKSKKSVKYIQRSLNRRIKAGLVVDGIAGPATRRAFEKYKKSIGDNRSGYTKKTVKRLIDGFYSLKVL